MTDDDLYEIGYRDGQENASDERLARIREFIDREDHDADTLGLLDAIRTLLDGGRFDVCPECHGWGEHEPTCPLTGGSAPKSDDAIADSAPPEQV